MKRPVIIVLLAAGSLLAAATLWPESTPEVTPTVAAQAVVSAPQQPQTSPSASELPMIETIAERERSGASLPAAPADPGAVPVPDARVVASLRDSMRDGDPRTPPLAPATDLREPPSAQELADPALYQQYQQRQQQQVYASFVSAAQLKLLELDEQIARGRHSGLTEEQLQEGIRKRDRLREQRDQLLAQQPELAASSSTEGQE